MRAKYTYYNSYRDYPETLPTGVLRRDEEPLDTTAISHSVHSHMHGLVQYLQCLLALAFCSTKGGGGEIAANGVAGKIRVQLTASHRDYSARPFLQVVITYSH